MLSMLKKANWIVLCLGIVVALQSYLVIKDYVRPLGWSIRKFGLVTSLERSMIMYLGNDEAKYVRFLNNIIPPEASVVIPGEYDGFSSQNIMQFYLLPRAIHSHCGANQDTEACKQVLGDPSSFVLAVGDFPQSQEIPGKVFLSYPDANDLLRGVYIPARLVGNISVDQTAYDQTRNIPLAAPFIDLGVLLAFFVLGSLYTLLILRNPGWLGILSLGIPLGMFILSWTIFITSYFNIPISLASISVEYILLAGLAIGLHFAIRKSPPRFPTIEWQALITRERIRKNWDSGLLGLFTFLWLGLSGLISLGRAYTIFDDIANWCLKGYAMADQGSIQAGSIWGGHILAYPMNIQLSIAVFRLADGDSLPGSKALFPLLAASLLIGCYRFWRDHGASRQLAILGLLVIFSTPLFFIHSTYGMADLPLTIYLVLGVLWSLEAQAQRKTGHFLMAGILFAGAAWTRPEGIGYSLAMVLLLALFKLSRKGEIGWKFIGASFVPLSIPITWLVLLGAQQMRADQIGHTVNSSWLAMVARQYDVSAVRSIFAYTWHYISNWQNGLAVSVSLLLILILLPLNRWFRDRDMIFLAVATLIAVTIPTFMFFTESFVIPDFEALLSRSFARACLPAIVLLITLTIMGIKIFQKGKGIEPH